jgi:hypothetical protein
VVYIPHLAGSLFSLVNDLRGARTLNRLPVVMLRKTCALFRDI